ncbi:hypothetical protein NQ317_007025, partial [Molorchus minor]
MGLFSSSLIDKTFLKLKWQQLQQLRSLVCNVSVLFQYVWVKFQKSTTLTLTVGAISLCIWNNLTQIRIICCEINLVQCIENLRDCR